jgi:hypothetical protein
MLVLQTGQTVVAVPPGTFHPVTGYTGMVDYLDTVKVVCADGFTHSTSVSQVRGARPLSGSRRQRDTARQEAAKKQSQRMCLVGLLLCSGAFLLHCVRVASLLSHHPSTC